MARKLTSWGLALVFSAVAWWAMWRGCDAIYAAGELHGRYIAEQKLTEVLNELGECREALDAEEDVGLACDRKLLDCTDSARFTEWRPL